MARKIYTRTGDEGETGLLGGPRLPKDATRIEAYGAVDELNAVLGLVRCTALSLQVDEVLQRVQNELFDLGAELATPRPAAQRASGISAAHATALEEAIDRFEAPLAALNQFILPGGSEAAARLHLARTVCRRAERRLVTLIHDDAAAVSPELLIYLNRLSDLLFVLARAANQQSGHDDVIWRRSP